MNNLVEALKTKAKPTRLGGDCAACTALLDTTSTTTTPTAATTTTAAVAVVECDSCRQKMEPRDVFPRTYEWIAGKFGAAHFPLLLRKGCYPYDHLNDHRKLRERCLPPIEAFYNFLTDSPISPSEYRFAQTVWSSLGLETMEQFCEIYLSLDTLLLGDILVDFQNLSLRYYKLDGLR